MTVEEYEAITGLTVTDEARTEAMIAKTQRVLESMLGYTLESAAVNEYNEIGKTASECPCPTPDLDSLDDPDEVVGAYRMFDYDRLAKYFVIDPCTEVHAIKLVNAGITYKTLDVDEYRVHFIKGLSRYIEKCSTWCRCHVDCDCVQLAVDAEWMTETPNDLLDVWAEMVAWYGDQKANIRSETLGTHSYTKFSNTPPEMTENNLAVIRRYAGSNGTAYRVIAL